MPTGPTTICNLALGRLGSQRILDITEDTVEGRACALQYPVARDELLRMHRWNFAIDRDTLTALASAPAFGWAKQYALPGDCLRVLQVNAWEDNEIPPRWEVEGRFLLTDENTAEIKFIKRETDVAVFDSVFVSALSCKLAAMIAKDVTGSSTMATEALTEYERILGPNARRMDAHEGRKKRKLPWVESDLVHSRRANDLTSGHDWGIFV